MPTRTTIAFAWSLRSALLASLVGAGCSDDETIPPAPPPAVFAADWAARYDEVRDCRRSADHDLLWIRVLADEAALGPYLDRDAPFPEGAVVFKAQYADPDCTDLDSLTAMRREAGFDPGGGDWHWQRAEANGTVTEDGVLARCKGCHQGCGVPPDGFDYTCAVP